MVGPWDVSELEIWERPPSTLENIDGGPLGGADGDLGVPTINVINVDVKPSGPPGRSGLHPSSASVL
jgi:hypothetical protein